MKGFESNTSIVDSRAKYDAKCNRLSNIDAGFIVLNKDFDNCITI